MFRYLWYLLNKHIQVCKKERKVNKNMADVRIYLGQRVEGFLKGHISATVV